MFSLANEFKTRDNSLKFEWRMRYAHSSSRNQLCRFINSHIVGQHHKAIAVDIVPEKVEMINYRKSPIQDDYIEKYLAEKELDLTATLDAKTAYTDADFLLSQHQPTMTAQKISLIRLQFKMLLKPYCL